MGASIQPVSGLLDAELLALRRSLHGLNVSKMEECSKVERIPGGGTCTYKGRAIWKSQRIWEPGDR